MKDTNKLYAMLIIAFILHVSNNLNAQIPVAFDGIFLAKEYSKEMSLYNGKTFVIEKVLAHTNEALRFKIDALAAAHSGELTTLSYKCEIQNKEGLILGFYKDEWNNAGSIYKAYGFKNLPINEANEFINLIEKVTNENSKYIESDYDNNNVYFTYKDITVLIYNTSIVTKLRIYWNGFDSEWEWGEFKKTKNRMIKKLR